MVEHGKARKTGEGLITNSLVPSPHLISKSELVKDFKQRSNSIQSDFFFFSFLAAPMAYGHSRGIECCLIDNARALNRCATAGNP